MWELFVKPTPCQFCATKAAVVVLAVKVMLVVEIVIVAVVEIVVVSTCKLGDLIS